MICFQKLQTLRIQVVTFIGPGGAGKGTQAKLLFMLVPQLRPVIIVTSDVINKYKKDFSNSPGGRIGERLRKDVQERAKQDGGVVTSNVDDGPVCDAVDAEITAALNDGPRCIILDGFPRTIPQGEKMLGCPNILMVNLQNDLDESLARAEKRRQEAIERDEEPRGDDKPGCVRRRFKTFAKDTQPMVDHIRKSESSGIILDLKSADDLFLKTMRVLRQMNLSHAEVVKASRRCYNPKDEACTYLAKIQGTTSGTTNISSSPSVPVELPPSVLTVPRHLVSANA